MSTEQSHKNNFIWSTKPLSIKIVPYMPDLVTRQNFQKCDKGDKVGQFKYNKYIFFQGAAIIGMMDSFLGRSTFQQGLTVRYIPHLH